MAHEGWTSLKLLRELLHTGLQGLFDLNLLLGHLLQSPAMPLKVVFGLGHLSTEIGDLLREGLFDFHLRQLCVIEFMLKAGTEFTDGLELSVELFVLGLPVGLRRLCLREFILQGVEPRPKLVCFSGFLLKRLLRCFRLLHDPCFLGLDLCTGLLGFGQLTTKGGFGIAMAGLEFCHASDEALMLITRDHHLLQGCNLIGRTPCLSGVFESMAFSFVALFESAHTLLLGGSQTGPRGPDLLLTLGDFCFGFSG